MDGDQKEPSLTDIVKMLSAMDKNMDKKVESVKADLSKSICDQAANLEISLKRTIDDVVAPIVKRQDDYEVKSDERMKHLEGTVGLLENTVANLSQLVKEANTAKTNQQLSNSQNFHPPMFQTYSLATSSSSAAASIGCTASPTSDTSSESTVILDLVTEARTIIGIGPVYPSDLEHFGQDDLNAAIRLAAVEALRLELNIKEHEINDSDIASTFLPNNPSLKIPRVYIRFYKQEHADLCLKLAKGLKNPEIKVFRYFPRQLQARVRALEEVAYPLRNISNPGYKTEVVYTHNDVQLLICPRGQARYYPHFVANLPPIDMAPARSPPPGRPRHNKRKNRSDSHSPKGATKSSRLMSPTKHADTSLTDDAERDSSTEQDVTENPEQETTKEPIICETPTTRVIPPPLPLPAFQDLGGFSDIQVISPLTGKLSFNFKEPVNLRRQSLNM